MPGLNLDTAAEQINKKHVHLQNRGFQLNDSWYLSFDQEALQIDIVDRNGHWVNLYEIINSSHDLSDTSLLLGCPKVINYLSDKKVTFNVICNQF